ncbi:MAG: hypothetical protein WCH65_02435 [bacterium]
MTTQFPYHSKLSFLSLSVQILSTSPAPIAWISVPSLGEISIPS